MGLAWIAGGIAWAGLGFSAILPLLGRRAAGSLTFAESGVVVQYPAFLREDLFLSWTEIERVSTFPLGDGVVFDGRLTSPTLVLALRGKPRNFREIRRRWTGVAPTLRAGSSGRRPPPSRIIPAGNLAFNLDCDFAQAQALAARWDAVLLRPAENAALTTLQRPLGTPEWAPPSAETNA